MVELFSFIFAAPDALQSISWSPAAVMSWLIAFNVVNTAHLRSGRHGRRESSIGITEPALPADPQERLLPNHFGGHRHLAAHRDRESSGSSVQLRGVIAARSLLRC
jgi:hypothetical protein